MTLPQGSEKVRNRPPYGALILLGMVLLYAWFFVFQKPYAVTHQTHLRQGECFANLKVWFTEQLVTLHEKGAYTASTALSGFNPERGNRYAYFAGPGPLEDRGAEKAVGREQAQGIGVDTFSHPGTAVTFQQLPASVARQVGVSGQCPRCDITMACMGQIDDDETLDVWTISTAERKTPEGVGILPGQPFNDVNDDAR